MAIDYLSLNELWRQLEPKLAALEAAALEMLIGGNIADMAEYKYYVGRFSMVRDLRDAAQQASAELYSEGDRRRKRDAGFNTSNVDGA
jgi:hypothetical protein